MIEGSDDITISVASEHSLYPGTDTEIIYEEGGKDSGRVLIFPSLERHDDLTLELDYAREIYAGLGELFRVLDEREEER